MKNKEKLYSVLLASTILISFFIFDLSTAFAPPLQNFSPTVKETQITSSGEAVCPAIYNGRVVWKDYRNENWDIYMYDLSTQKETRITDHSSDQVQPAIYGDKIVWEDWRNEGSDIYMYDLSTKKEIQITRNGSASYPAIYKDRIVWQDTRNEKSDENEDYITHPDIYMYNLSTKMEAQITSSRSTGYPAIYGDRIVWNDHRNGMYDIYMYDLSTNKETRITSSGSAGYPAIYGDSVVYDDYRNGTQVYLYDLSIKKETQISNSESAAYPAIYKDRIAWQDNHNEKSDENEDYITHSRIYTYNLSTSRQTQITNNESALIPKIYDDMLVWYEYHNGKTDIYIHFLNSTLPVADFSASQTTGSTPFNVMFTDKSMGVPDEWNWNFGDGTNSTEQNPNHTYSAAGNYKVMLIASSANGNDTKTSEIKVQSTSPASPGGFNSLIFVMIVLYFCRKSTLK
jgi:beta propeller repeat protein